MSQFPKDFLWGAATAAYQVKVHMTLMVKDYLFGMCSLICRAPRTKGQTATSQPITIIVLKKMWR